MNAASIIILIGFLGFACFIAFLLYKLFSLFGGGVRAVDKEETWHDVWHNLVLPKFEWFSNDKTAYRLVKEKKRKKK